MGPRAYHGGPRAGHAGRCHGPIWSSTCCTPHPCPHLLHPKTLPAGQPHAAPLACATARRPDPEAPEPGAGPHAMRVEIPGVFLRAEIFSDISSSGKPAQLADDLRARPLRRRTSTCATTQRPGFFGHIHPGGAPPRTPPVRGGSFSDKSAQAANLYTHYRSAVDSLRGGARSGPAVLLGVR